MKECSICGSIKRVSLNKASGMMLCEKHSMQYKRHGKISKRTRFDKNEIVIVDDFAEIYLYDKNQNIVGKTKIDTDDVDKCKNYKFFLKISKGGKQYVQQRIGRMHLSHIVTGFVKQKGYEIDHINGDSLDNRKENLRIVTHQHNMMNQRVLPSNNTSGEIGVTWNKRVGRWDAQLKLNGKHIYLGTYDNIEDAIAARKNGEIKYFGEYKTINFEDEYIK
jgi:hypothetical protein